MRTSRRRHLVVALGVLLTACGKDSVNEPAPPPPPPPPAVVARVEIGRQSGSDTLAIQGTTTLTARALDAQGTAITGRDVTWTTADTSVATVSSDGVVTAMGLGTVVIRARIDTASASTSITVSRTAAGAGWVDVATGFSNTCAVTSTGSVYCWGTNVGGQLGDSTTATSNTPVRVKAPATVRFAQVAVASRMACALTREGDAWCWGDNANYGIGSSLELKSTVAVKVDAPAGIRFNRIRTGSAHACAVTTTGSVYCWGFNDSGQLGNGNTETSRVAVAVALPAGVNVRSLSSGSNGYHTCAVTQEGTVYCWGRNIGGQFGIGSKLFENSTPVLMPLPAGTKILSSGSGTSSVCLVRANFTLVCLGSGSRGELGTGSAAEALEPAPVVLPGSATFDVVRGGYMTTCALSRVGELYCWGAGTSGQLGVLPASDARTPIRVPLP